MPQNTNQTAPAANTNRYPLQPTNESTSNLSQSPRHTQKDTKALSLNAYLYSQPSMQEKLLNGTSKTKGEREEEMKKYLDTQAKTLEGNTG
jgi:hypothetical protein